MSSVQLRRNMCRQPASTQRFSGKFRVRCGRQKVSSQGEEHFDLAAMHSLDAVYCIAAMLLRRFESVTACQFLEKHRIRPFRDAHGTIALDIAMTSNGTDSGSRPADVAAH